ncbi:carbohydrate-binding family 9-like protein [Desulfoluna sp.]|uniref:carbohydrate-binding family 9-like protein n=1 Tax=Desulfoluna sp. TaxID=2045199 RepID=UPI00261E0DBA|nr:carbohydrate-binding family 9-like protein [Desulfoluna sp.]
MTIPSTTIPYLPHRPQHPLDWNGSEWSAVPFLTLPHFRPESSDHRPPTRVKLACTPEGICGLFDVIDRFVRCTRTHFQDEVYKDSCVEFFIQPKADCGYFNFEFNCGGALLASYITDPTRTEKGFEAFSPLSSAQGALVKSFHSLPRVVDPERQMPTPWLLGFFMPFALLESFVGPLGEINRQHWRGNLYKCADASSHPHWGSWAPVDALNFHRPQCFGRLDVEA